MHFQSPHLLLHLCWALPVLLLLAWLGAQRRQRLLAAWVAHAGLARELTSTVSPARRWWRLGLLLAAVTFAALAAARPQWGSQLVPSPSNSRDLLVLLDTSRSMLARDVPPTRLQHAKLLIRRVLEQCPGDRFGLIAFAGDAFLECPLTHNHSGFQLYLQQADTSSIPLGGTNLERALAVARQAFGAAESTHRAVLLITDGDVLDGEVSKELDYFREQRIPIFVVGLGDAQGGAFIQLPDNTFVTDAEGNRVRSKLNEPALQAISQAVGGTYVHSTVVYDGVAHLAGKIRELVPEEHQATTSLRPIERYYLPLALALLCLLARLALGERRRAVPAARRLVTEAAALALLGACWLLSPPPAAAQEPAPPAPAAAPSLEEQVAASLKEELGQLEQRADQARQEYQAKLDRARTPVERAFYHFQLGVTAHQAGKSEAAARHYEQAIDLAGEAQEIKAAAYRNLGVLHHQQAMGQLMQQPDAATGELQEAERYYREALRYPSGREPTGRNLELALRHRELARQLKELQQQMQQQMDDARKQTEEAREAQQQANQAGDQQSFQQQTAQAGQQAAEAQQSLDKLAEQARQAGQEQAAQQLEELSKQVQQAREEQAKAQQSDRPEQEQRAAGKQAEEKLAEVARQLGAQPEPQDPQPGEGEQQQANQAQQEPPKPDQPQPAEQGQADQTATAPAADATPTNPAAEFDKQQALGILEAMQANERDMNQEVKRRMQQQGKLREAVRDW
jgi:Ca-activated chloride channel family protein